MNSFKKLKIKRNIKNEIKIKKEFESLLTLVFISSKFSWEEELKYTIIFESEIDNNQISFIVNKIKTVIKKNVKRFRRLFAGIFLVSNCKETPSKEEEIIG